MGHWGKPLETAEPGTHFEGCGHGLMVTTEPQTAVGRAWASRMDSTLTPALSLIHELPLGEHQHGVSQANQAEPQCELNIAYFFPMVEESGRL